MLKRPTVHDMQVAVWMAYRRHGEARFRLPPGPVGAALAAARGRGWIWCPDARGSACVTRDGIAAIKDFLT
jgi:hypothetical protein